MFRDVTCQGIYRRPEIPTLFIRTIDAKLMLKWFYSRPLQAGKKSGHAIKTHLGYSLQQSSKFESNLVNALNFALFELFFAAYLTAAYLYLIESAKISKLRNRFANGKTIHSYSPLFVSLIIINNACNDLNIKAL